MIYIKNTNTNEIEQFLQIPSDHYGTEKETFTNKNGITCQRKKLKSEYIVLTLSDLEVQEILLEEIKKNQIALIKKARDQEIDKDHIMSEAFVLNPTGSGYLDFAINENGEKIKKQFRFSLKSGKSSINQPHVIITRVLLKTITEPDYYLKYSCIFLDNKQGYVAIDKNVASSISNHLEIRGTNAVFLANECEEKINSIVISKKKNFEKAKSEIEAISFN
jgi:hypothetical protein